MDSEKYRNKDEEQLTTLLKNPHQTVHDYVLNGQGIPLLLGK